MFFTAIKRRWLLLVIVFLATAFAWTSIQGQQRRDTVLRIMRIHGSSGILSWRAILNDQQKPVTESDFIGMDFSLPGDRGFGDDPDNEFFNSSGRFKAQQLNQDHLVIKPLFNVRRHFTKIATQPSIGTKESVGLYAIIPLDINCSSSDASIQVAPNNHEIVTDVRTLYGCHRASDGLSYYFFPLIWSERFIED